MRRVKIMFFSTLTLQILGIIVWNNTEDSFQTFGVFAFFPFGILILAVPMIFIYSIFSYIRLKSGNKLAFLDKKLF